MKTVRKALHQVQYRYTKAEFSKCEETKHYLAIQPGMRECPLRLSLQIFSK